MAKWFAGCYNNYNSRQEATWLSPSKFGGLFRWLKNSCLKLGVSL